MVLPYIVGLLQTHKRKLICRSIGQILKIVIPFQPERYLLNFTKPPLSLKCTEPGLDLMIAARNLYNLYWKKIYLIPSREEQLSKL